ncbi:hypothetical protein ACOMICROBIO_GDFFDHBD_04301 [Vibrio sp. B1REV9]|nr:hypothetical protein ACOMICROBIO_GDFFDHBD_04301 [Vibrio sp. B1REV9]
MDGSIFVPFVEILGSANTRNLLESNFVLPLQEL